MLARKEPSSRFEIAAPIWRAEIKTPLENETKNERVVNVASWRGFSKLAYKFYSFCRLGDRRLNLRRLVFAKTVQAGASG